MLEELRTKLKDARLEKGADLDREIALDTGVSESTQRRFVQGHKIRDRQAFKLALHFGYPRPQATAIAEECAKSLGQRTA